MIMARFDGIVAELLSFIEPFLDNPYMPLLVIIIAVAIVVFVLYWRSLEG